MNCPACASTQLQMTERQGVEIDYCPKCRGVWLDRGELDKIIERSSPSIGPSGTRADLPGYRRDDDGDDDDDRRNRQAPHPGYPQQPYRKKSLLKELFDF